ncbi:MAG: hypothetical protein Q9214_001384 [Letrouitia sp. 1 TL-2023]
MNDSIVIAVDGQNGDLVAESSGIRRTTPDPSTALIRYGESRDGQHGVNASQPIPGAPAGFMAVKLSESASIEEGIHVRVLSYAARLEPPAAVEIPARRDVLLTAIGGVGEPGRNGGEGQNGTDGVNGQNATRETDATAQMAATVESKWLKKFPTVSTFGVQLMPGSAGRGTEGAVGGDGGSIEIFVDEDATHLLFASNWDVRGGQGGEPGRHGQPGKGGHRGIGGKGHKWTELVGYTYTCTPNCVGSRTDSASKSLVRTTSKIGSSTMALMASVRAQAIEGGNLQAAIASVAARYGARRHNLTDPGACHCANGTGNCIGCESKPMYKDFRRNPGHDGRDGLPGSAITTPLLPGAEGQVGECTIVVGHSDGTQQRYTSRYDLHLTGFDIEDGNGDGIFEPGGMPSPMCRIPIYVTPSKFLLPTIGSDSCALIPSSIAPGTEVTLADSIKVLIRQSENPPSMGTQYFKQDQVLVKAIMPWLNRDLPFFEFSRSVDIQYPIELRNLDFLPAMAPGSTSRSTYEVYNKGSRALGSSTNSQRSVEVSVAIPENTGALNSTEDTWAAEVGIDIQEIRAGSATVLEQVVRIASDAPNDQHMVLRVDLYISVPLAQVADDQAEGDMQLVHQNDVHCQVSSRHVFNPRSRFLLVTNSQVEQNRTQALLSFINNDLGMDVDLWNVSLYGGLQYRPQANEGTSENVIRTYQGRSIIFLDNQFGFFGSGARTVARLCDTAILSEACVHGTGLLFLGSANFSVFRSLSASVVQALASNIQNIPSRLKPSSEFRSVEDLVSSVYQSRLLQSTETNVFTVPVPKLWYRSSKTTPTVTAKRLAKYLRQRFPQERFLVTTLGPDHTSIEGSQRGLGKVIILHGCPKQNVLLAAEPPPKAATNITNAKAFLSNGSLNDLESNSPPESPRLSLFEMFMVVSSLPPTTKCDIMWLHSAEITTSRYKECSEVARRAILLYLQREINYEIDRFLDSSAQLDIGHEPKAKGSLRVLALHFPTLYHLFSHPTALTSEPIPQEVVDLLAYAEASVLPRKKRQVLQSHFPPFFCRRSQVHGFFVFVIDALLEHKAFTADGIRAFHNRVRKDIHSNWNRSKRDTTSVVMAMCSEFTRKSTHAFTKGQLSSNDVVPRTEVVEPTQWDERWKRSEAERLRVAEECRMAQEELGARILEA